MTHSKITRLAGVGMLALGLIGSANAGQLDLVVNGKSIHVNADKDWNESNWGLGFEYEFNPESRWVKVAMGNAFVDSEEQMSYMAGGGIKRRFLLPFGHRGVHVDLGAVGFVMTRQDVANNRPFPGVLPAFSVGTRRFAINATYLPGRFAEEFTSSKLADPNLDGILFLQFKMDLHLAGFRPD